MTNKKPSIGRKQAHKIDKASGEAVRAGQNYVSRPHPGVLR